MTTQSLYEIKNNYSELLDMVLENIETGVDVSELMEALEITKNDFNDKALSYCKVIQNEQAQIDSIEVEIKRLQENKKNRERKIDILKYNLSIAMKLFGKEKIDIGLFKLSFRKSEALEVPETLNIDSLPNEFVRVKKEVDKTALKTAIKSGSIFEGISIVYKNSLQIK